MGTLARGGEARDRVAPLPVRRRNPRIEGLGNKHGFTGPLWPGPHSGQRGRSPRRVDPLVAWGGSRPACVRASRSLALARWVLGMEDGTGSPTGVHGPWSSFDWPLRCHHRCFCFRGVSTTRSLDPQERMSIHDGETYLWPERGAVGTLIYQPEPRCTRIDACEGNLQAGRIMCGRVHRVRGLTPPIYRIRHAASQAEANQNLVELLRCPARAAHS